MIRALLKNKFERFKVVLESAVDADEIVEVQVYSTISYSTISSILAKSPNNQNSTISSIFWGNSEYLSFLLFFLNPLRWKSPWHGPFFLYSRFSREISCRSQKFFLFLRARPFLFPIWLFSIFEKGWIFNLYFPSFTYSPIEISKTRLKIWLSILKNLFEWKNFQNKAHRQKWSASRTISRQPIISASRRRVNFPYF